MRPASVTGVTSTAAQNTGLALLAAAAIGASAYAYWSVNRPPDHSTTPAASTSAPAVAGSTAAPPDGASASSADDAATTTDSSTSTADPAGSTSQPASSPLASWVTALKRADHLLVLGDGRANEDTEWVQVWSGLLAADRPVSLRHWGEAKDWSFTEAISLPGEAAEGDRLTVWSASRRASSVASVTELLPRIDSASADPDAILVSLGAASADEDVPAAMNELLAALPEGLAGAPVLVLVGPAGSGSDPGVDDALASWAQEHDDEVALVDLREGDAGAGDPQAWAQALQDALAAGGR